MRHLPAVLDPAVLVGTTTSDDAAVYKLTDELALVATVDYITPVVDDPFDWGRIAAANALSDVYAMGARPLFALNLVNFPREKLPLTVLEKVLEGGAAAVRDADIAIIGGHSVDDPEPKYGLVALGTVDPRRIFRNTGARAGDALLLTKPLGTGILTTALKGDLLDQQTLSETVQVMATLNRAASEVLVKNAEVVHAVTDVTGFGLLGHLTEMLGTGNVGLDLDVPSVPLLPRVLRLADQGLIPGGSRRNLEAARAFLDPSDSLDEAQCLVLADAQTSGGLLAAVDPSGAQEILIRLREAGAVAAARIGTFTPRPGRVNLISTFHVGAE